MTKTYSIPSYVLYICDSFRITHDDFDYAFDMFERELFRMKDLTRPLSQKEKHLLTASFNALIDIQSLQYKK